RHKEGDSKSFFPSCGRLMRRMVSLSDHQLEIVTTAASRAGRAPFCLSGTARRDAENASADSTNGRSNFSLKLTYFVLKQALLMICHSLKPRRSYAPRQIAQISSDHRRRPLSRCRVRVLQRLYVRETSLRKADGRVYGMAGI
ncbi:MAG: hypothetical protein WA711_12950, partial [Pseudolabrys sp.]